MFQWPLIALICGWPCQCPDSVSANQSPNCTQLSHLCFIPSAPRRSVSLSFTSPSLPLPHLPQSLSRPSLQGGSFFSLLINVLRPIKAVTPSSAPVICSLPPVGLAGPVVGLLIALRSLSTVTKSPLIEFMQPLLFLNSHFVSSDGGCARTASRLLGRGWKGDVVVEISVWQISYKTPDHQLINVQYEGRARPRRLCVCVCVVDLYLIKNSKTVVLHNQEKLVHLTLLNWNLFIWLFQSFSLFSN